MQIPKRRTWIALAALALLFVGIVLFLNRPPQNNPRLHDPSAPHVAVPEAPPVPEARYEQVAPHGLQGTHDAAVAAEVPQELRVLVTVLDPGGAPVVGAAVELVALEPVDMPASPTGKGFRLGPPKRGMTDRTGRCAFRADAPGQIVVSAPARDGWLPASAEIDLQDDADVRLVFRLSPDVRLVVVDDEGRPAVGCQITVRQMQHGPRIANAATDPGGLPSLAPGARQEEADIRVRRSARLQIALAEGRPAEILRCHALAKRPVHDRTRWGGVYVNRDLDVARAVSKTHPEEALRLYDVRVEELIARTKPDAYTEAAEILEVMRPLYRRVGRPTDWEARLDEIRVTQKRKRRLLEILDGLAGKPVVTRRRRR